MTLLFVVWLLQDFAQLLLMGICIVPDVFLMTALFMALLPGVSGERQTKLVWAVRWRAAMGPALDQPAGPLRGDRRRRPRPYMLPLVQDPGAGAHCGDLHSLCRPHASALFRDSLLLLDDAERLRRPPARRAAADGRAGHRRLLVALLESIFRPWLAGVIPAST